MLNWLQHNSVDDRSKRDQVTAVCRQAISHYPSHRWTSAVSPLDIYVFTMYLLGHNESNLAYATRAVINSGPVYRLRYAHGFAVLWLMGFLPVT